MAAELILIVLVEDDDGHASLVEPQPTKGRRSQWPPPLSGTARRHLDYVQGKGAYAGRPTSQPMLLLLDIKMPRVDGVEVLRQLKSDPQTALVPVIMLTTTDDPREIQRCYELGCSVYITKPVDYQAFVEAINRLGLFLQVVRIPDAKRGKP